MEGLAGRVILLWGWRRFLAAFIAGALAALAQAPFDFFAACFVSFPVLVLLLDGAADAGPGGPLRRFLPVFATGWWFGFGYFLAGLWWTGEALIISGAGWALPFAVLGLPAVLAVFYGLAAAFARLLWDDGLGRIAALALGFGLVEWLRAVLFTGFPWNAIGYAAMPVPVLMQSDRIFGLFGMSALAVFVFAAPALLAAPRHRRVGLALAAVLAAAHVGYGVVRLGAGAPSERTLAVRIVQPSIDQGHKWDDTTADDIFRTYLGLTAQPAEGDRAAPRVVVWPETALPFLLTRRPDALSALAETVREGQTLLVGAVREDDSDPVSPRYYNSVLAIDASGEIVDAVDKLHLVPFGEYIPFSGLLSRLGIGRLVQSVGPFTPGSQRGDIALGDDIAAVPFICYEIIFPGLVDSGVAGADLMVNVTNDAWFGDTPGPYQHLRQAQLRAVETGLPLVRAANSGISAVVDPYGRIIDALAVNAYGVLDVAVPLERADRFAVGSPPLNGLLAMAFLGILCVVLRVRSALRSN